MIRPPPRSTRTDTLFPYTTLFRSATQAGIAFSNASVALVHGMSRPIGAHFHVPHGLSNAMLLPTVTRWSLDAALDRYAERSEEHTSELQSLMRISTAVFCLKKKNHTKRHTPQSTNLMHTRLQ